ncbi:MAG: hypothetical protein LUD39_04140 [Opitutae bacterium]|nr:hypothetical protein [Opitutae bacterium]
MTVDTDSRKLSAVDIYEDAAKSSKQSSTLDAVGDFCDDVKVYFVGSNPPAEDDAVELVAAYDGTSSSVLLTEDGATTFFIKAGGERGEDDDGVYYIFRPNFTHETLQSLFESKSTLNLTGAFVVTNSDSGKHVEFQFPISAKRGVYNTTLGIAPDGTGDYSAILVVRLTWEEYCTLDAAGELSDTTVYMVSGAPTEEGESVDVATTETSGTVKLSTDEVQTAGTPVGLNADGQLDIPLATSDAPGVIKLASKHYDVASVGAEVLLNDEGLAYVPKATFSEGNGFGVVRLMSGWDDEGVVAVPTVSEVKAYVDEAVAGVSVDTTTATWATIMADATSANNTGVIPSGAVKLAYNNKYQPLFTLSDSYIDLEHYTTTSSTPAFSLFLGDETSNGGGGAALYYSDVSTGTANSHGFRVTSGATTVFGGALTLEQAATEDNQAVRLDQLNEMAGSWVTTDTEQTISGVKTFSGGIEVYPGSVIALGDYAAVSLAAQFGDSSAGGVVTIGNGLDYMNIEKLLMGAAAVGLVVGGDTTDREVGVYISNATNTATLTLNGTSITPDNYVTLNGRQFITGEKSFYSDVYFAGSEGIVFPDSSKAGIIFSSGEPVSIAGGIDFYNSGWIKFEYTEGGIDVLCDCRGGAYTFWQDSDKKIADAKFSRSALTLGSGEGSGYVLTLNSVDVGAKLTELEARIAALEAKLS